MVLDVSKAEPLIEAPSGNIGPPRHHHCGIFDHRLDDRASHAPAMMSGIDEEPFDVQEAVCCSARGDGIGDGIVLQDDMPFEAGSHQLRGCFRELSIHRR
nr:hypothetical protein [Kocuria rhizophila]